MCATFDTAQPRAHGLTKATPYGHAAQALKVGVDLTATAIGRVGHGRHHLLNAALGIQRQTQLHVVQRRTGFAHAAVPTHVFEGPGVDEAAIDLVQPIVPLEAAAHDAAGVQGRARGRRGQDPSAIDVAMQGLAGAAHPPSPGLCGAGRASVVLGNWGRSTDPMPAGAAGWCGIVS